MARIEANMQVKDLNHAKKILTIDEILENVGECGIFQIRTQAIFVLFMLPCTYQILIMYFAGDNPSWRCKEGSSNCTIFRDITPEDGRLFLKRCHLNRNEWEYSTSLHYSIVTQFDLICEKEFIASTANSMLFVSWIIGGLTLPYFADKFGRKKVLYPAVCMIIITAVASSVADNLILFIAGRFVIGFCEAGIVAVFVLATELVGPNYRSISGTIIWFYFTIALITMTLWAYLLQNWKHLELVCSLPFIVIILTWRFVPESVRYLRLSGKLDEAMRVFADIAKVNGKQMPDGDLEPPDEIQGKASLLDLFRPAPLAINTLIQMFAWFVCGLTFYGVSLASRDLGGDLYRDFALTSLVEFPANFLVIILTDRFGRRPTITSNIVLAAIACIGVAIIPTDTGKLSYKLGRVALGMFGKYAATLYFNAFYIWSAELNATIVRTQAMGLLVAASRFGAAFSPFVVTELKYIHPSLPFALMGVCNLLAAVFCLHLRETRGEPTPETINDSIALLGTTTINDTTLKLKEPNKDASCDVEATTN